MIWKQLSRFPFLEISETGILRRLTDAVTGPGKKGYIYKPKLMPNGYYMARINPGRGQCTTNIMLHRLVAEAFICTPDQTSVIDHIDGDKRNNHYTNLRLCTQRENCSFANKTGHLGITLHARDRYWQANICAGGKAFYLGSFKRQDLAQAAYDQALLQYNRTGQLSILYKRKHILRTYKQEYFEGDVYGFYDVPATNK